MIYELFGGNIAIVPNKHRCSMFHIDLHYKYMTLNIMALLAPPIGCNNDKHAKFTLNFDHLVVKIYKLGIQLVCHLFMQIEFNINMMRTLIRY